MKAPRTAIYVRVSTNDKGQTTENQLYALRAFCEREGYDVREVYEDHESGTKGRRERAGFDRMFAEARAGRLDLIVFWSLDRFSRQGIRATVEYLNILDQCGVAFRSYTEQFLDTTNELVRTILVAVLSHLASLEAQKISERTKAGLARARREGKRLGRPDKAKKIRRAAVELFRQKVPKTEIAARLGVSVGTVRKALSETENHGGGQAKIH